MLDDIRSQARHRLELRLLKRDAGNVVSITRRGKTTKRRIRTSRTGERRLERIT